MDDAYQRVLSLSDQYRYWGYRTIFDLMKGEGQSISREGLQVVRKRRKRKLLGMTVVDEFTRQEFEITVGRSLTASDVIRILDKLFAKHGRPVCLRSDNGPERVSRAVQNRLKKMHVDTHYIDRPHGSLGGMNPEQFFSDGRTEISISNRKS